MRQSVQFIESKKKALDLITAQILDELAVIKDKEEDAWRVLEGYTQILSLLRSSKGTDFTYYKQTTIRRRILRRMAINKNEEPSLYLKYLRENKTEQDVLYLDLLIPVTSFFRDAKTFDNLCETVFPLIAKNKTSGEPIRLWVAGCSTGEEAYSIAICLKEFLGNLTPNPSPKERGAEDRAGASSLSFGEGRGEVIQIFATDVSEPAIAKARAGIYTKSDAEGLSPQRLQDFFTKNNGGYQANKSIRDMCVFAAHNFLKDPPFGKMDFISCRNVLIYMEPYLQKKALTTFHYSLNPKGFLLLGKSETTGSVQELFALSQTKEGKSDKLFIRKDVPGRFMHIASQRSELNLSQTNISTKSENIRTDFQKTADDIMLSKYTPAGVVVNEAMDIVHFRGNSSNYLQQSPGKPSHNLLKMAKEGLAFELRNILHKAKKQKTPVIKENIPVQVNGVLQHISIEALLLPDTIEPHYLVLFHDKAVGKEQLSVGRKKTAAGKIKDDDKDLRIQQLEKELAQSREDMRSITEDQEAANEELQSANEELLSSSEELQSLNEELETGKEELQSTNEELMIVNQEMISLNEQVTATRDYAEAIIANIHEPLLVLDKNLRIRTANNAFYKTFRVDEKETEAVLIYNLGNKQWDIPDLRRLLEKILPEKSVFNDFEVTHIFSTIGERVMLLNAREVINKNSSEKLILLSIEDITERKKAQEILNKTGEHFRHLVKELPAAVYSCDAKGYINFYNDAAVKVWGRKPEIGKDQWCGSYKIFKADGSPLALDNCPMAIALKEGRAILGEEIIIERPDGSCSNVLVYPQPEFGLSGEITGAINMVFDITEQVITNKKIKESEAQFNTLANNIQNLAWMANADGWIFWYNNRWYEYTGTTPEEMEGWGWKSLHDPEQLPAVLERWQHSLETGESFEMIFPLRGADNTYRPFLTRVMPMYDKEGKVIRWIGTNTDISEQKRISTELTEAIVFAEMATVIAEEAKTKAEDATHMAEDAVKAKQQFLSNMSHEIRTPMNAIIGFTKVILKTELTVKQREYLNAIKLSGNSLIVLINDILDLAKVEAGKMSFEEIPFKMSSSITAMIHLFETKVQEKNLELVKEYDDKIPEVLLGDPVRLHQIILNLVSNAVKFTSKGKITVSLHMVAADDEKVTIEFKVSDTGIGIPEDKTEKIFENFHQATSDTTRLYGGTGLGLAIVKQLVESQGGKILLKTEVNKGSSFSFTLNFKKTDAAVETETEMLEIDPENKNIKVLVVEDIALNQLLMKTLLDEFGFEREIAANGIIAIEKLQAKAFDIILMDLQMPEMNGFEATEYIRKSMNSNIPIIALTADVTTVDLEKCKAVGMNDYIAKPVDERLLYSKIVGLVKNSPEKMYYAPGAEETEVYIKSKCTDLAYLISITKYDIKLMMEMIELYLDQTPTLIKAIKKSLPGEDWEILQAAVHKLIPSFAIMGIGKEYEMMAKKVQEYARLNPAQMAGPNRDKDRQEIKGLVLQLTNVCMQACAELEEEYNTLKNSKE